jgi:subtilisin family serine protease
MLHKSAFKGLPLVLTLGFALPLYPDFQVHVPTRFTGTRTIENGATIRTLQWVDGQIIHDSETTRLPDGSELRTKYKSSPGQKRAMISRELVTALNKVKQRWAFGDDGPLSHVDTLIPGTAVVLRRIIESASSPFKGHEIIYDYAGMDLKTVDPFTPLKAKGFEICSPSGETVAKYDGQPSIDPLDVYTSSSLAAAKIQRRIKIFQDPDRMPVAVLEVGTGLDISHPDIAYKLWNPRTFDNLGDPTIKKAYGWDVSSRKQSLSELIDPYDTPVPESHGTNVGSVLVDGNEKIGLVFFGGIGPRTTTADFSKIISFINANTIRVANLSISFPPGVLLDEGWTGLWQGLDRVIASTPQTLWVAAAGNDGWDIGNVSVFPASYPHNNLLVIGALETHELIEKDFWRYCRASFSNFNSTKVDLFAPGVNLVAAEIGGRYSRVNGTSFSAPYAVREGVLELLEIAELTSPSTIKQILIDTGYVSRRQNLGAKGGILFPRRAQLAAELLRDDPSLTVEEAILTSLSRMRLREERDTGFPG